MDRGCDMRDMSVENGYGTPSDKANSNGQASYPNASNQPMMDTPKTDFTDARFAGNGGTPSPLGPEPVGKSAIVVPEV